jgi:hypothetical protein
MGSERWRGRSWHPDPVTPGPPPEISGIVTEGRTGGEILPRIENSAFFSIYFAGGAGNRRRQISAEPAGIEGNTAEPRGSGEGAISRGFSQVDAGYDARHTADADAAREYLSAGARGDECAHLALKLASVVLASADVKLAFEVLAGGAFAHARATELASLVLAREAEATGVAGDAASSKATVGDGGPVGRRAR